MEMKPLNVSEVNQYIKKTFVNDWLLSNIKVEGEISNFTYHYSGHMYFTLKDEKSKIKCVMFKSDNRLVDIDLKDGLKVIVTGYISIYEKEGNYQLYAKDIKQKGIGDLFLAFEKLKAKLEKEGLFDSVNKKEIPYFPKKIGIVTSSTGAAVRDIITVIKRRFDLVDVLIYPVLVQGVQAPKEICEGLIYLDDRKDIDVIIVGRGGGSIEELFAFNDETIARTIFNMEKPVVSAVGHETDFTIADFVADLRAPTPSAAAELVTPKLDSLKTSLIEKYTKLNRIIDSILKDSNIKLQHMKKELYFYNPMNQLREKFQQQDDLLKELINSIEQKLKDNMLELENTFSKLKHLSPVGTLERGYSIILDEDGNIVTSVDSLNMEKELEILVKDGILKVKVVNIKKGEFKYG